MFTGFYNLTGRPFQLSPDPRFFYGSRSHNKAMAYLTYGLNQGEGFIIITGDIGTGKTTLVGHLLSQLDSDQFIASKVVTTQIDADDTLRMVASAFGIPEESRDKATLLREVEAFFVASHESGKRVLLVIDEVQNLPAPSLEELRMLSNFQVGERAVLQPYLLGQQQFRQTLASPQLEQLRQRVIASYHLEPLDAGETREYIEHRLGMVGWKNDPSFTDEAFGIIHETTRGVPRRINTLCSRLLLFGFLQESHEIRADAVEEVVKDLAHEELHAEPEAHDRDESPPLPEIAPVNASAVNGELTELAKRVEVLEQYVKAHERTIKRALEIAADYLDDSGDGESDSGPTRPR